MMTAAVGMTVMTIVAAVVKEGVIRFWRLWERTGWSIFVCATEKEEVGANSKEV